MLSNYSKAMKMTIYMTIRGFSYLGVLYSNNNPDRLADSEGIFSIIFSLIKITKHSYNHFTINLSEV